MGSEPRAEQLAEELSLIELESGRLLDDDSLGFMAQLRARSILTQEEWSRIKQFLRSALEFLSASNRAKKHDSNGHRVIDPDADPRNADWLQLDAAQRLAGRSLPSWAALWLWQLRASDSSLFWRKVGRIAKELGIPAISTVVDESELVFDEKWKAHPSIIVFRPLRREESPLGNLSASEKRWLETAFIHLNRIDQRRMTESSDAYCIFEAGRAYFQCFAPTHDRYFRCESVSEEYVPEIAQVLTREKKDRLVREFGFAAPGASKNSSRKIEIRNAYDLAYVARLALRILRDIYDVRDFELAKFKSSPEPNG
ncbi:hypothetical protein QCM77_30295 [Bradyrhizobium sp. SSUT18]|uniref:TY-Chap domain-containing protein n=1 Tax=Bradyrhizobium sp. SSUT18 TaxID=3040602 RepID=UPI0024496B94|nr:hypothetical protein [Bradyrhizobium sp. SSUT18]MDH2404211.1 hypothetical protein [Bradyrhizobium sp. SSUT18]